MGVLAPFYLLGLTAISLPLVFHLIRRSPRSEMPFSSDMFLVTSPPRITRRSRLEHLLLLLLRGLVIALLACAFARPFLRQTARVGLDNVGGQRFIVLVDTSASMRRENLWELAVSEVDEAITRARPQDHFAVYTFDESLRPVATYEDLAQLEPSRRRAAVNSRLENISPSWSATNVGQALMDTVNILRDTPVVSEETGQAPRRVVLISDMQAGSRLSVIGQHAWPKDVTLELVALGSDDPTNANLRRLADVLPTGRNVDNHMGKLRILVTNATDSSVDRFQLRWVDADGSGFGDPIDVYVPAGESRVTRVRFPPDSVAQPRLVLHGDAHDFDNTLYLLPHNQEELTVVYIGDDSANDPQHMRYYLERAIDSDPAESVRLLNRTPGDMAVIDGDDLPHLIVATATPSNTQRTEVRQYIQQGGSLLYVVTDPADGPALGELFGVDAIPVEEGNVDGYTMLGDIAFDHPLFAPMAGPQFNDFTQIRFWKYRRIDPSTVPDAVVLARFENDDPAIMEKRVGRGKIVLLATGWHPSDGQLARSWKFLLMLSTLMDDNLRARTFQTQYVVNNRLNFPVNLQLAEDAMVIKPGAVEELLLTATTVFTDTDRPGLYTLSTSDGPVPFVVHLDPVESDTTPLPKETFEQAGCRLTGQFDTEEEQHRLQQLRDVELESRQKIWKWLVAVALGVLIVETMLAGWSSQPAETRLATT